MTKPISATETREGYKPAHPATIEANNKLAQSLPYSDQQDFEDAARGHMAPMKGPVVNSEGKVVWDLSPYKYIEEMDVPPDTINPSLWRQAKLNMNSGLFRVAERVYQVRGLDLSNITIIEGDAGLIIVDPVTSVETAKACMDLYFESRPMRDVVAVIYTHSHADHYGGVKGVISEQDVLDGKVKVIAPDGFIEAVGGENVLSGNATYRRGQFQFGTLLRPGPSGQVDAGLGKTATRGARSLIAPNVLITEKVEKHVIDGVEIEFYSAPDSEAPAEIHMYYPQFKILNMAENVTHHLHNLCPIRGAVVRDPRLWSHYLSEAIELYGDDVEIMIAQHHWPVWGRERVVSLLEKQRDLYKFIHDQTLRGVNKGQKPAEIAEHLSLPKTLSEDWWCRGYYGTVNHNSKAVYQRYLSWYDANPSNLHPLPPVETARKTIEYMGGVAEVLKRAKSDFDEGNFRWVAQVLGHAVFAEPDNEDVRFMLADTFEQLGYQAESATWRNAYLYATQELRFGVQKMTMAKTLGPDLMAAMDISTMFDFLGVRLMPEKVEGDSFVINWVVEDRGEILALNLSNGCLTHIMDKKSQNAVATVSIQHSALCRLILGETKLEDEAMTITGDDGFVTKLFSSLDEFPSMFNVVTPLSIDE